MPNVISYADRAYQQKKALYDSLSQMFHDIKNEKYGKHGWNLPVEQINGVTMRFVSEGLMELTYHRYEVCTVEGLARDEKSKFLGEVVKELKKRFKKYTGKALTLSKVREDRAIDKHSRLQADNSWMLGSSRYGYGARPIGRYLVRDSCVYAMECEL